MIGFVGRRLPGLWLLLLSMPVFAWFLSREKRSLQSLMVVFLDGAAREWNLAKAPCKDGNELDSKR